MPLPIVVLDDAWLSLIRVKQHRRGFGIYGTEVAGDDRPAPPAHYFGVPVVAVRGPEELEKALREALRADGPTVIEALVDGTHYAETVYELEHARAAGGAWVGQMIGIGAAVLTVGLAGAIFVTVSSLRPATTGVRAGHADAG